jgi:hypothetical protein
MKNPRRETRTIGGGWCFQWKVASLVMAGRSVAKLWMMYKLDLAVLLVLQ